MKKIIDIEAVRRGGLMRRAWTDIINDPEQWHILEEQGPAMLSYLIKCKVFSPELLKQLMGQLNWELVFTYQKLSREFILEIFPQVCLMSQLDDNTSKGKFKHLIKKYQGVDLY